MSSSKTVPLWAWRVRCPDYDEEWQDVLLVWDYVPHKAAERWAKTSDRESSDYTILNGRLVTVEVIAEENYDKETAAPRDASLVRRFSVSAESVPTYTATEIGHASAVR